MMKNVKAFPNQRSDTRRAHDTTAASCIGRIAGLDENGDLLVRFNDGQICRPARLVAGLSKLELAKSVNLNREVLLNFVGGDPEQPIVVALMADSIEPLEALVCLAPEQAAPETLQVDGKRIAIEAADEIILKCGPGSIMLRNDGKIILKGIEIVTRAKGANKIKGGTVQIN